MELISLDPDLADRYPAQLSGGQQQRVGVARALAADPGVMLMDEPFGAVDPINRERLQNEFLRLQAEVRKTILFVTHDIDEAIKMGDRVAILREGGILAQYATPAELLMAPADDFVEDFVGADRALKRLALLRVADIDLWEAPLAFVGQATAEVRAKLEGAEVPHALLVDSERRPLGWLSDDRSPAGAGPGHARHLSGSGDRPRRRDARRPVGRAAARDDVRARRRRRWTHRGRPLGRDHLRVPGLQGGAQPRSTRRWSGRRRMTGARRQEPAGRRRGEQVRARASGELLPPPRDDRMRRRQRPLLLRLGRRQLRPLRRPLLPAPRDRRDLRGRGVRDRAGPRALLAPPPRAGPAAPGRDRGALHDPERRILLPPPSDHRARPVDTR